MLSNSNSTVKSSAKVSSEREFGFVFTVFFSLISVLRVYQTGDLVASKYWVVAATSVLLLTLIVPRILRPFNRAWLLVGDGLHKLTLPIIMGLIFFLIFTPFSVIARAFRWDPLRLNFKPNSSSYWIKRSEKESSTHGTMKNQF